MNRLFLYKILLVTSVFILYCSNYFQTFLARFVRFRVHPIDDRDSVKDVYEQLIDIKDFKFLINSRVCESCSCEFLLIVMIFSALENDETRNTIRNSWGKTTECIKIVFLVGTKNSSNLFFVTQKESELYDDIVQGNFIDTYRNLTYKHVMGLKWVSYHCARANFVLKTDDDLSVDTAMLWLKLKMEPWGNRSLIACAYVKNVLVTRVDSKWAVSKDEFADDRYPVHCGGSAIVYSIDMVPRLLEASNEVPFFWIEDIYVTGMLSKKIGVDPVAISNRWMYFDANEKVLDNEAKKLNQSLNGSVPLNTKFMYEFWRAKARSLENDTIL